MQQINEQAFDLNEKDILSLLEDPDLTEDWDMGGTSPLPNIDENADVIDLMVTWFLENFEDPDNETPYDGEEGGYLYIWGGPFDAHEILEEYFETASPQDRDEAVNIIEEAGYEWAPNSRRMRPVEVTNPIIQAKRRLFNALTHWNVNEAEERFRPDDVALLLRECYRLSKGA